VKERIGQLLARFDELERLLAQPDAFADQKRYRALTQEHAYLSEVKNAFEVFDKARRTLADNVELLEGESDAEMRTLLEEEIATLEPQVPQLEAKLQALLVPPDPNDSRNIILELRAGTGGDEAALFVGDCVRMYELYAAERGWKTEPLAASPSEVGGFREYIMSLSGTNVHRFMQYEGGTHRVQRVPETETQGRIHTSAITVAVLLEPDNADPEATPGAAERPRIPVPEPRKVVQHPPRKAAQPSSRAMAEAQPALPFAAEPPEYDLPPLSLLTDPATVQRHHLSDEALEEIARMLESVLDDYGVRGEIVSVRPGPVVTMYELEPAPGLKASRVIGLADDIARSMSALSARVSTVNLSTTVTVSPARAQASASAEPIRPPPTMTMSLSCAMGAEIRGRAAMSMRHRPCRDAAGIVPAGARR